jgi:preprotein translocase subunit YajC
MGNMILAKSSSGGSSSLLPILFIVVIFVLLYFVMIRPQRNRQRRAAQTQQQIGPGQRIRTTAGIYGVVTAIMDDDIEVEVSPGVRLRMMRRAIMDVLPDEIADPEAAAAEGVDGAAEYPDGESAPATTVGEDAADEWESGEPAAGDWKAEDTKTEDRNSSV